jgi:hypothetical protein
MHTTSIFPPHIAGQDLALRTLYHATQNIYRQFLRSLHLTSCIANIHC